MYNCRRRSALEWRGVVVGAESMGPATFEIPVMGAMPDWVVTVLILAVAAPVALWTAGALYYDVGSRSKYGLGFVGGWFVCVGFAFVAWRPLWQPLVGLLAVAALFFAWWLRLKPSHDREWDPAVAVLPRATQAGDAVTIENVRNFDYRSLTDFTPRYEARTYHLANLQALDVIFFTWGSPWMSHPVLVFDFGSDGRVCISIEVRYRKGQKYSIVRSLYRQHELIFLVADERDAILRRTKYAGNQKGYLYRLKSSPEELRNVFLDYVGAVNDLYVRPRWYHGLFANCTTSFYRLPHSRVRRDWRVIVNSRLDKALYETGRLDRTLPFPELRRAAYLNDVANAAPADGFGDHLRRELERRIHER